MMNALSNTAIKWKNNRDAKRTPKVDVDKCVDLDDIKCHSESTQGVRTQYCEAGKHGDIAMYISVAR